jgi:hypothetical protein
MTHRFSTETTVDPLKVLFSPVLPNVELPRQSGDLYSPAFLEGIKKLYFYQEVVDNSFFIY